MTQRRAGRWWKNLASAAGNAVSVSALTAAGLSALSVPGTAWASSPELVRDLEKLRASLPLRDSGRPTLTLRLADLLFDEANELAATPSASDSALTQAGAFRKRALSLYQEVLTQEASRLSLPAQWKIRFQRARLQTELGAWAQAAPLWLSLEKQEDLPELRREAALRLAEHEEQSSQSRTSLERAFQHYDLALQLCGGGDSCSYVRYRRAWLKRNLRQMPEALGEMRQALFDSRGQIREESLRDFLMFLSEAGGDGEKALLEVEELSSRLGRKNLLHDLAYAYLAQGNRGAGTRVLERVNEVSPLLSYQVRLLEENLGSRNSERVEALLGELQASQSSEAAGLDSVSQAEVEKILRRVILQLDGERVTKKGQKASFQAATETYLKLFPASSVNPNLREGWLASETEPSRKLSQLKAWIQDVSLGSVEVLRLREMRASVAQKASKHEIVVEEMKALSAQTTLASARLREFRYLGARAAYALGRHDEALPVFQALAAPTDALLGQEKYSIESQNLALDILAQQKRFSEVQAQAAVWTRLPASRLSREAQSELQDLNRISDQARFEGAVTEGKSAAALATFLELCQSKKFSPQSCDNARVLAVGLRASDTLVKILELQGRWSELVAEWEAKGQFLKAAQVWSAHPQALPQGEADRMKLALLFELGGDFSSRDRLLGELSIAWKKSRRFGVPEALARHTLADAGLLKSEAALELPWSEAVKGEVAESLEAQARGGAKSRAWILASSASTGEAWNRWTLEDLRKRDQEQARIDFTGKSSRQRFEQRVQLLKKLTQAAEARLPGADASTRVKIAQLLQMAHDGMAQAILASPIPAEVQGEAREQVLLSLQEMAAPFLGKAEAYAKVGVEQQGKVVVSAAAPKREALEAAQVKALQTNLEAVLEVWKAEPSSAGKLSVVRDAYLALGQDRLAAYMSGRLQALSTEGSTQ